MNYLYSIIFLLLIISTFGKKSLYSKEYLNKRSNNVDGTDINQKGSDPNMPLSQTNNSESLSSVGITKIIMAIKSMGASLAIKKNHALKMMANTRFDASNNSKGHRYRRLLQDQGQVGKPFLLFFLIMLNVQDFLKMYMYNIIIYSMGNFLLMDLLFY